MEQKPSSQAKPEGHKPLQFKTMQINALPQPFYPTQQIMHMPMSMPMQMHMPQQGPFMQSYYTNQLFTLAAILNNEANKKFYQNEVMQIKMTKLDSYAEMSKIRLLFRSCEDMNDPKFNPSKLNDAEFFVLRSTCDDDIHKAIKYGLWTSTHATNLMLNQTYNDCQRRGVPVYLIFTLA